MRFVCSLGVLTLLVACGARSGLMLDVDGDAAPARDATFARDASMELDAALEHDAASDRDASDRDATQWRDGAVEPDAAVALDAAIDVDAAIAPDSPLDLESGGNHTCVVLADRSVRCWGFNSAGQIGYQNFASHASGVPPNAVDSVVQLALGSFHSCARAASGTVTCWGQATSGQHGNGTLNEGPAATRVQAIDDAIDLWAGTSLTCARRPSGAISCWGPQSPGRDLTPQPNVIDVPELRGAVELAIGDGHGCARWSSGGVRCWGQRFYGQLGDGSSGELSIQADPVDVSDITDAVEVGAGNGFSCARLATGRVKCWGRNHFGQVGNGMSGDTHLAPAFVEGAEDAVELAVGRGQSCVRLSDGRVRCWGNNESGQAGSSDAPGRNLRAMLVPDLSDVIAITVGNTHSCAQIRDGRVRCWGNNAEGQLGNGTASGGGPYPVTAVWL